jgi:hypothetical protein
MTHPKIQGKFYPLQHEEWLRACRELTPAQKDVLYYIRTIEPYNKGIDLNAAEVARQLSGPGGKVHRQTVSRALKELDRKGFIDMELLQVRAKVKAKGLWCDETPGCDETPPVIMTHLAGSPDTTVDHETPQVIVTHHTESETVSMPESCNSKINKTNSDLNKTLSESEREHFLKFGLKKAAELPKPPTLPERWVWVNFDELYQQFRAEVGEAIAPSQDWANHPRREEWIAKIRQGRPRFVVLGGPEEERETRRQFAQWAEANNLIREVKQ